MEQIPASKFRNMYTSDLLSSISNAIAVLKFRKLSKADVAWILDQIQELIELIRQTYI